MVGAVVAMAGAWRAVRMRWWRGAAWRRWFGLSAVRRRQCALTNLAYMYLTCTTGTCIE